MQDFASQTFDKLNIPYISFRDLFWPNYVEPPENLPTIWNGLSHPDKRAHKLFSKLIAFAMELREAHKTTKCDNQ